MSERERMLAKKEGAVGTLVFNNPERSNAVSLAMWQRAGEILEDFESDGNLRVVVITGAGGKAFVSGADIARFGDERADEQAAARYGETVERTCLTLYALSKPTIAMIRGYCIGGGTGLAVCCDLRIATAESHFGIPAARLGLGYGYPGVKRLVDLIGPSFAKEMLLTARRFTAAEALSMGLVNRVVPDAALESCVAEYTSAIAENAPLTMQAAKLAVGETLKGRSERDIPAVEALVKQCFASEDYKEGRAAFIEKRKPAFRGE